MNSRIQGKLHCVALCMAVILISACSSSENETSKPAVEESFVSGSFHYIAPFDYSTWLTGESIPMQPAHDERYYFETEDGRIRVYGAEHYEEQDFYRTATVISEQLDSLLANYGINYAEYVELSSAYSTKLIYREVVSYINETVPDHFANQHSAEENSSVWRSFFRDLTPEEREERLELSASISDSLNPSIAFNAQHIIRVKLSASSEESAYGDSNYDYVSIGPLSRNGVVSPHYDTSLLLRHLARHIDMRLSISPSLAIFPNWYSQGAAFFTSNSSGCYTNNELHTLALDDLLSARINFGSHPEIYCGLFRIFTSEGARHLELLTESIYPPEFFASNLDRALSGHEEFYYFGERMNDVISVDLGMSEHSYNDLSNDYDAFFISYFEQLPNN